MTYVFYSFIHKLNVYCKYSCIVLPPVNLSLMTLLKDNLTYYYYFVITTIEFVVQYHFNSFTFVSSKNFKGQLRSSTFIIFCLMQKNEE